MQPEKRTKTNVGVGIGLILQMLGVTFAGKEDTTAIFGIVLLVASVPIFVWGCMNYAEGKGHSKSIGLVGLAGLIGLIVLVLLPDQAAQSTEHPRLGRQPQGGQRLPAGRRVGEPRRIDG